MSTLYTDNIRANNASQITVPTGQKIVGTDSASIVAPGHILQVKYAQRTDALSYTTTYVEALSVDITPTSTSSLILIRATTAHWHGTVGQHAAKLVKNSNLLNFEAGDFYHNVGTGVAGNINIQYVDAANTTSLINYKIFVKAESGSGTLNKDYNGALNGVTSLIVMEIAQ
jgi:hypothetical protein